LLPEQFAGTPTTCPGCRSELHGAIFPAFWQTSRIQLRSERAEEGEAACFFHPEKKAAVACERCGRFVCTLCAVDLHGRSLCASCLGQGLGSGKIPDLVNSRFLWSQLALALGFLPLIVSVGILPALPFTGAAAIFVAIYGWKKPGSLVQGPRRWAAVLGLICGIAQLVVFAAFGLFLWNAAS
jgi:hypothetical protein